MQNIIIIILWSSPWQSSSYTLSSLLLLLLYHVSKDPAGRARVRREPFFFAPIYILYTSRPGNPAAVVPRKITFGSGPVRGRGKKPLNRFYNNIIYYILYCGTSYRRSPLPDWAQQVYLYYACTFIVRVRNIIICSLVYIHSTRPSDWRPRHIVPSLCRYTPSRFTTFRPTNDDTTYRVIHPTCSPLFFIFNIAAILKSDF